MRLRIACAVLVLYGPAAAADRRLTLVNLTGRPIDGVYISEDGANAWGWDVIDPRSIEAGAALAVRFPLHAGDCLYDVRVTYKGGGAEEWYKQADLCRAGTIVFEADRTTGTVHLRAR